MLQFATYVLHDDEASSVLFLYLCKHQCNCSDILVMMRQLFLCFLGLLGLCQMAAQNPVIRDQFTADPTARVFNGKVYLYPSHDIVPPQGQRQDWFCMADYHVFSSENLTDWQDHGVIVTQNKVPWVQPDSYSMWAPDCVCKDGKYYFFFPSAPKASGRGFAIGVAVADQPEGPFTCEREPIRGVAGIDPCVLVDTDGQSYIYWSGMGIRGARLKANMKELDGELSEIKLPQAHAGDAPRTMVVGGQSMEGLPEGFKEGPFVFRRGSHYYLTFPWVRKEGGTETLAYAMSDHPLGPWTFQGIIMEEWANGCWTNHHSLVEYRGEWYLFYHHNDYSPHFDKNRSVCIDRVSFNADGTIRQVTPTRRGVGINKATDRVEVDRYSTASSDVVTDTLDRARRFRGWYVTLPQRGSNLTYGDVDFGCLGDAYLTASVKADANTEVVVREQNARGPVIARLKVICTTDGQFRRDYRGQWLTVTAPLQHTPSGVADLYVECMGSAVSIDWMQFKNRPHYFSPVGSPSASTDDNGFIRRWMLLEPIDKPNRSNTVFTDSYLREQLGHEYFRGQFSMVPRDGQKVKAGRQTLRWHAVDSQQFNVKLFRFADLLGKQTYGVLFWAVTIIECDNDIPNVRLSVGSNGASMWWLNGEEALLMSGDRRMVKDDGVSARLTLKKGRNILRGAVINGPGMSDFCVRFVDEKGLPVKGYKIKVNE